MPRGNKGTVKLIMLKFIAITLGRGEEKRDEEEAGGEKSRLELRGEKITLLLQLLITIHFLELNASISTLVRFGFNWVCMSFETIFSCAFRFLDFSWSPERTILISKRFKAKRWSRVRWIFSKLCFRRNFVMILHKSDLLWNILRSCFASRHHQISSFSVFLIL